MFMGGDGNEFWVQVERLLGEAYKFANMGQHTNTRWYKNAIECMETVIKVLSTVPSYEPGPYIYTDLAVFYTELGNLQKATELYKMITEKYPDCGPAWLGLGKCYFLNDMQPIGTAIECLENAKKLSTVIPGIVNNHTYLTGIFLGRCYMKIGDFKKAATYFMEVQSICPGDEMASLYYDIGICLASDNSSLQESKEYFTKALELEPLNPKILSNFGVICMKLSDFKSAQSYFKMIPNVESISELREYLRACEREVVSEKIKLLSLKEELNNEQPDVAMPNS